MNKQQKQPELVKVKCHCPCHFSKGAVKHAQPCCEDGYIYFDKELIDKLNKTNK